MSDYLGDYTAEFKRGKDKRPRKRRRAIAAGVVGTAALGLAAKYKLRGAGKRIISGPGVLVSKPNAAAAARRGRGMVDPPVTRSLTGSPSRLAINPGKQMKMLPASAAIAPGQSSSLKPMGRTAKGMAYKAGAIAGGAAQQAMKTTVRSGRTARQTVDATIDGYRAGSASPGAKSAARKLGGFAGRARRKIKKATGFSRSRSTANFTRRWS